ncbi:MAG: rod shape-determining protein MreD [Metallibacterium scheffleri]|nr:MULTISPECIES: rod shape-determining protein MreD [Metallibacterium]MBW8073857.1 rod shape-determining protein MreD [Metallibacterium scheffleri]
MSVLLLLLPLPDALRPLRPWWPALVLLYWVLEAPDRVGLGTAFITGLAADVLAGALLGDQALRLLVVVFLAQRFRARLRFFPMPQQSVAVLLLLLNDSLLRWLIRAFAGMSPPPPLTWVAPLVGAALWPFVFLLLDALRARLRAREP